MGTKNNPAPFDCYDAAEPDEPMFVLLARDGAAPLTVEAWIRARSRLLCAQVSIELGETMDMPEQAAPGLQWFIERRDRMEPARGRELDKLVEAQACAEAMRSWKAANRPPEWMKQRVAWASIGGATPEPVKLIERDGRRGVLRLGCPEPFWLDGEISVRVQSGIPEHQSWSQRCTSSK